MSRVFSAPRALGSGKTWGGGHVVVQLSRLEVLEHEIERVESELKECEKAGMPRKSKKLREKLNFLYNLLEM